MAKRTKDVAPVKASARSKASNEKSGMDRVYQLRISLVESEPEIWRRTLVPGKMSLGALHDVIQGVMGWDGGHLHQFILNRDTRFSEPTFGLEDTENEHKARLCDIAPRAGKAFGYEYDFGDSWLHRIKVEKIVDREEKTPPLPVCVDGANACPPEDCGGLWGYYNMLEAIDDPANESHEEMLEWLGGGFDPTAFDPAQVNKRLEWMRKKE